MRYLGRVVCTLLTYLTPSSTLLSQAKLKKDREDTNAKVERCTHTSPVFPPDGWFALGTGGNHKPFPVIAKRWSWTSTETVGLFVHAQPIGVISKCRLASAVESFIADKRPLLLPILSTPLGMTMSVSLHYSKGMHQETIGSSRGLG